MKFYLLFLFALFSCSQKEQESRVNSNSISMSRLVNLDGINQTVTEDLGTISYGKELSYKIQIKNITAAIIAFAESDFNFSNIAPLQLVSNTCTLVNSRSSCVITLKVKNTFANSSFNSELIVKNKTIQMSGTFSGKPDDNAPIAGIIFSENSLNFGSLRTSEEQIKNLTINNTNPSNINLNIEGQIPAQLEVVSNNCSSVLSARSRCVISYKMKNVSSTVLNQNLQKIANHQITYSVTLNTNPIILNLNPSSLNRTINLTDADIRDSISFKNDSISSLYPPFLAESTSNAIDVDSVSCSSQNLTRGSNCIVSFTVKDQSVLSSSIQASIILKNAAGQSSPFSLTINKAVSEPCAVQDVANSLSVSGNKPACQATSCIQYYSLSNHLCVPTIITLYSELNSPVSPFYTNSSVLTEIKVKEIDLKTNQSIGIRASMNDLYFDYINTPYRHIRNFNYSSNYPKTPITCSAAGGTWTTSATSYVGMLAFDPQFVSYSFCELPQQTCLDSGYFYQTTNGEGLSYATFIAQDVNAPRFKLLTEDNIVAEINYHNYLVATYPSLYDHPYTPKPGKMPKCVGIARIQDQQFSNQGGNGGTPQYSAAAVNSSVTGSFAILDQICPNGSGFFSAQDFIDYGQALLDYLDQNPQAFCRYPTNKISEERYDNN